MIIGMTLGLKLITAGGLLLTFVASTDGKAIEADNALVTVCAVTAMIGLCMIVAGIFIA